MQKISGILPSSARITTVDLKEAGTARPGSPSWGRPSGESNLKANSIVRSAHRALNRHNELMDVRSKDHMQAEIARRMSENFFKTKAQMAAEKALVDSIRMEQALELNRAPVVDIPAEGSIDSEFSDVAPVAAPQFDPSNEEHEIPIIGGNLDVVA